MCRCPEGGVAMGPAAPRVSEKLHLLEHSRAIHSFLTLQAWIRCPVCLVRKTRLAKVSLIKHMDIFWNPLGSLGHDSSWMELLRVRTSVSFNSSTETSPQQLLRFHLLWSRVWETWVWKSDGKCMQFYFPTSHPPREILSLESFTV